MLGVTHNAGKSFLGALVKCLETGEYRKPIPEENIYRRRLGSDLVEGCQLLGPWASGQRTILGVVHCHVQ